MQNGYSRVTEFNGLCRAMVAWSKLDPLKDPKGLLAARACESQFNCKVDASFSVK